MEQYRRQIDSISLFDFECKDRDDHGLYNRYAQRTIHFDSRKAGGGKTTDIINATSKLALSGTKCLIVQPTIRLIEETFEKLRHNHPDVDATKIHSEDGDDEKIGKRVINYLKNTDFGGEIILITHQTFLNLPYFHRPEKWQVYLDETISGFEHFSQTLPNYHSIITDHVKAVPINSKYAMLVPISVSQLEKIAVNAGKDEVQAKVQALARRLLSTNYNNYVDQAAFQDLQRSKSRFGKLSVFSVLSSRLMRDFKKVTIAGARFEETFLHHWWQREGTKWRVWDEVARNNSSECHPHNKTIDIYYGYERKYSKYLRDELGTPVTNPLIVAANELMGKRNYVRVENNDVKNKSLLNKSPGSHLIPGISHGLNEYRGFHHAVVITATNLQPDMSAFLSEYCDFDDDAQFQSVTNHSVYQSICRTSIRDDDTTNAKTWVVACRKTADRLRDIFPGSRVHSLGLTQPEQKATGRPRTNADDKERKRRSKELSKAELALGSGFARRLDAKILDELVYLRKSDESTISDISHFVSRFKVSYFDNYESNEPYVICNTNNDMISYLRSHVKNVYAAKNEIPCVSGAMFRVSKSDKSSRGNENVEFVRGMWLDIEKGNMTHEDLSDSFPQLHIVAYNTFNHTDERPRYRAYIPTSRAMTGIEYRTIYAEILYVLESRGYEGRKIPNDGPRRGINSRHHGIDHRPAPCSVFTLPCKPNDGSKGFFKEYKGGDRVPLDVDAWLSTLVSPQWEPDFDLSDYGPLGDDQGTIKPEQQAGIDAAEAEWYGTGVMPGEGDDGILALYHALYRLRLPPRTIGERLYQAAKSANSPTDRRKQVDRLMAQLSKQHRLTTH